MELVPFAKVVLRNAAEQAASFRLGQAALRHLDRGLWVVEKCARWAVPPPLDQEDTPQPELVRPLPWVFFLAMLMALRVTRESISLFNLILGKPPLRSADVVAYIQSKRRYLRTLKYQGNRIIRSRSAPRAQPWYSGLQAMFEFTMCFRRSHHYGNNNTTRVSNNDNVLVVKRGKRTGEPGQEATTGENSMERLLERMMVDLDADSDDDSSFTLTNATSPKSDRSEYSEAEDNTLLQNDTTSSIKSLSLDVENESQVKNIGCSTPEKNESPETNNAGNGNQSPVENDKDEPKSETAIDNDDGKDKETLSIKVALSEPVNSTTECSSPKTKAELSQPQKKSPKEESQQLLQSERCSPQKQPSKHTKFGRKIVMFTKKFTKHEKIDDMGIVNQRRATDMPIMRVTPADDSL